MAYWCKNLDKHEADWLCMLINKQNGQTIEKISELIRECLVCWDTWKCKDSNDLFNFLKNNYLEEIEGKKTKQ